MCSSDLDVIVRWGDREIAGQFDLSRAVSRTEIGSEVAVTIVRKGQRIELTVTVGRRPAQLQE